MDDIVNCVEQHITSVADVKKVIVAYSGGADSHVLLSACAKLNNKLHNLSFLAVYIDHGLHEDSLYWSEHCQKITTNLSFPFSSQQVYAKNDKGEGPEQAARRARYAALSSFIDEYSVLLTAQHQDDQAETLMLQLLRGAGVDGLAGMPTLSGFGRGFISRPLLKFNKQQILQYAKKEGLNWVEDSSNFDVSYDRNFLRQKVIPLIQSRWPAFSKTTARSASHCAEASLILADISEPILKEVGTRELRVALIKEQKAEIQRLIIREWLKKYSVRLPSEKILQQIQMMLLADIHNSALVEWNGHQVRLFDGRFFYRQQANEPIFGSLEWIGEKFKLPELMGEVSIRPAIGKGIDRTLWDSSDVSIRSRQGGERIKLAGRSGSKKLKKLLNEEKILPWVRSSLPLIYLNDDLVAVADLYCDERYLANTDRPGYIIDWHHPEWRIK